VFILGFESLILLFVKHDTEQTVASTVTEILGKVARYTIRTVDAYLQGVGHFQHRL
jgi:hypothetical protein